MKSAPHCEFEVHRNSKQKIGHHITKNKDHIACFEAKETFDAQDKVLRKLLRSESLKVYTATCNVIKCVYFILRHDISANMFERLVNLLDVLNAIIGNQLHSRKTAAAIALAIDEVYLRMLVNYIISDECKYFSMEFDELTDKGLLKTLVSKIRLNEEGHFQSFVFNIFESTGTSALTFEEFKKDFFKLFEVAGVSEDETMDILHAKWVAGTADRASKMTLLGKMFFDSLEKYVHIPCDNHETETAWKETVKELDHLQRTKETVKDSYATLSRSSKRNKRVEELSDDHETKFKKLKPIFDVRFLKHLEDALDAEVIDHEEMRVLTKELSKDTSVKQEKRKDFKNLHQRLKNSVNFCEILALKNSLEEVLSPYQTFAQGDDLCVLDRKFCHEKMEQKINSLGESDTVSQNIEDHLEKIDFENKRWKASQIKCNQVTTKEDAISHIVQLRKEILDVMQRHKDKIHAENDPEELYKLANVFDIRHWNLTERRLQHHDNVDVGVNALHAELVAFLDNSRDFLIGENLHVLEIELKNCISILFGAPNLTKEAEKKPIVREAWKVIFLHPQINNLQALVDVVDRLTTIANTEASCERANSKYNRSKNKLSSTMKLPMILARNRAGSNGPPLHRFDPHPVFAYWKEHHTRLALKTGFRSEDTSRVLDRIRREDDEKYTTKIFKC